MMSTREGRVLDRATWSGVWLLISIVMVFLVIRVSNDIANLSAGTIPAEGEFDRRYTLNPWLAYLHIVPGVVYLLGAPFQFSVRVRHRSLRFHRMLGRVVLPAGLITGVFAIVVGVVMPFGKLAEAAATIVFGTFFLVALVLAYRAIRGGDEAMHRRWMIRAFAIGVGVGVIRIVVGVAGALGIGIEASFGAAFWIAFVLMTALAEIWLRLRPLPPTARPGFSTPR